jgi:hypothetical protein
MQDASGKMNDSNSDVAAWTLDRRRYWAFSVVVHIALIFGACLHFAYGPEHTIRLRWYQGTERDLVGWFPDQGSLQGAPQQLSDTLPEFWKLTDFAADAASYLLQAESIQRSKAPYKYRFVPTAIVGALASWTGVSILKTFIWLNIVVTLSTALLFQRYLMRFFAFSSPVALIGAALFIVLPANTSTVAFPMLEPCSLLFSLLVHMAAVANAPVSFALAACLGVATKEVLVVSSVLWWVSRLPEVSAVLRRGRKRAQHEEYERRTGVVRVLLRAFVPGLVPIVTYAAIRVAFGDSPASVNYGYDPLRGQLPPGYLSRLTTISGAVDAATRIVAAYSFLWLGLLSLRRDRFLTGVAITIPIVVMAAVLLSSSIVRVIAVTFPVVIPLFLLLFVPRPIGSRPGA